MIKVEKNVQINVPSGVQGLAGNVHFSEVSIGSKKRLTYHVFTTTMGYQVKFQLSVGFRFLTLNCDRTVIYSTIAFSAAKT